MRSCKMYGFHNLFAVQFLAHLSNLRCAIPIKNDKFVKILIHPLPILTIWLAWRDHMALRTDPLPIPSRSSQSHVIYLSHSEPQSVGSRSICSWSPLWRGSTPEERSGGYLLPKSSDVSRPIRTSDYTDDSLIMAESRSIPKSCNVASAYTDPLSIHSQEGTNPLRSEL